MRMSRLNCYTNAHCTIGKLSRVVLQQCAIHTGHILYIVEQKDLLQAPVLPAAACSAKPKLDQSLLPVILQPGSLHIAKVARPVVQ